jgi:Cu2+-exporting ATPase
VRATILANLAWAFGYNLVALSCAVLGLLQPILAAAVMAGSSVLVVLNSLRLERLPGPCHPGVPEVPAAARAASEPAALAPERGPALALLKAES